MFFFGSGSPWLSYTVARFWLALLGRVPWRLMGFLRDAHRRGVLRQIGPAYQLRHGLIQDLLMRNRPANRHSPTVPRRARGRRQTAVVLSAAAVAMLALPATALAVVALAPIGARCLVGHWRETVNYQHDSLLETMTTGRSMQFIRDGSGTLYLDNAVSTVSQDGRVVRRDGYAGVVQFQYVVREDRITYRTEQSSAEVITESGEREPMSLAAVDDVFQCVADKMTLTATFGLMISRIELERIK